MAGIKRVRIECFCGITVLAPKGTQKTDLLGRHPDCVAMLQMLLDGAITRWEREGLNRGFKK